MPSFRQIHAHHASLLVLDAASLVVQVGWLERGRAARWVALEEEAGSGLFRALAQLGKTPHEADAFGFCEGPGSILGIRTAAVALTTWRALRNRPIFAYRSLELLAATIAPRASTIIADARRQTWHALTLDESGHRGEVRRCATSELPEHLVMPDKFRTWTPLPDRPIQRLPYELANLWAHPAAAEAELWRETDQPDAFLHEEPSYVTWTPGIHRAPETASS